jgi:uncharacterized protein
VKIFGPIFPRRTCDKAWVNRRVLMNYFYITLVFFITVIALMSVGIIFGRKALKGSCGGLGALMGEDCQFCDKKEECDRIKEISID